MAIRLTRADSQSLAISSGVLDYNSDYTVGGWVYVVSSESGTHTLIQIGNGADRDCVSWYVGDGWAVKSYNDTGGSSDDIGYLGTLNIGGWDYVHIVRSGSSLSLYVNRTLLATVSADLTGRSSASSVCLGVRQDLGSDYAGVRLWGWKAWSRALTDAEIGAEQRQAMPVSARSIYGVWPFLAGATRALDYSGRGANWTETNSPTNEDPPSVRFRGVYADPKLPQAAAGGGSGAISGTATVALTGSGTLKGAGALGGTSTVVLTGSGALKGAGALVGTATVVLTGSGSLKGAGTLVGTATVAITGTGALKGAGALVGTATVAITGSGSLKGAGALGGTATVTFTGSASAGGESGISGTATVSITGIGELRGSGALAGAASVTLSGSGTLIDLGAGAISGTTTVTFSGSGTMTGQVLSVLTAGTFGPISIAAGSEWYITLTGPALDAPRIRITVS